MLQNIFFITSIITSILTISVLVVLLFLAVKIYHTITLAIEKAQEKADEIGRVMTEVGERSASLLNIATKEGQRAATAGTVLSTAMDAYFFFKSIFGKRK